MHSESLTFSQTAFPYPSRRMPVLARNVVATSHPLAAQAGLQMMVKGGNAVDAVLAAAITLTVVEPTANGLGSDAFSLIWDGEKLHGLNASGRSPKAWDYDHFRGMDAIPLTGWDTVTVPGAVDAWVKLSERFGRLDFAELFNAAIHYARNGFMVSPVIANAWKDAEETLGHMKHFRQTFLPGGKAPRPGERFANPDLADSLEKIAASNGDAFYRGELAQRIADASRADGGLMTYEDLNGHQSEWVKPVFTDYHGVRLHEIPPNGQGMTALMALGMLRHHDLRKYPLDSVESVHLQVEAMKLAFAMAHAWISEPAAMPFEYPHLLDENFLAKQAGRIRPDKAQDFGPPPAPDQGTVYLTAADKNGVMASYIQSNYAGFGSGVVIPGTGISLHNRGRGFSLKPGHPNCVDGGKRPYHTIIPGFVTKEGQPLMSFGVMGAHMQPQGHVQMMVRIFDYGQNPQAASDAPRWHACEDGTLALEKGFDPAVIEKLKKKGHRIRTDDPYWGYGGAQLIYRLQDGYCAASDHRKDGQAVGF